MKYQFFLISLLALTFSSTLKASPTLADTIPSVIKQTTAGGGCPSANFSFNNTLVCAGVPISFTNTSSGTLAITAWNFGDGTLDSSANPSHGFFKNYGNNKDTLLVTLTVTSTTGCTSTISKSVIFYQKPEAKIIGPQTVCTGLNQANFIFNNASSTTTTNTNYLFQWGDGTADVSIPSFSTSQSHTYDIGTNQLTEIVTGTNGCKDTSVTTIYLGSNPSVGIASPGNTYICANNSISFPITNTNTNSPGTTYKITFNDGTPAQYFTQATIPTSISHIYLKSSCGTTSNGIANSFIAKIEATNPCAVSQGSVTPIYVSEPPVPNILITKDTTCTATSYTITNNTAAYKSVSTAGLCSGGTFVWTILPATGFTLGTGQTLGNTFNNADPSSWLGSNSNTLNLKFTVPGTYNIRLYVGGSSACGSGFIDQTIVVNPLPVSNFTISSASGLAGCAPFSVSTNNSTGAATYGSNIFQWSVSYSNTQGCAPNTSSYTITNGSLTSANPQFTFNNPGVYTIGLLTTAPDSACASALTTQVITVKTIPNVSISLPATLCSGQSFTPTAAVSNCFSATAATYLWNFNGGTPANSTQKNPGAILIPGLGAHTVSLAATNECGTNTDSKIITVNPAPTISGSSINPTNCANADGSILLSGLTGNTSYTVTYTKGSTPVTINKTSDGSGAINITGLGAGLYSNISVNIVGTCASNIIGPFTLVDPSPGIPVVTNNGPICSGGTLSFTALSPTAGVTYTWTGPNGYTSNQQNPSISNASAAASGTYFVTATISNCNAGATNIAIVNPTPTAPTVSNIAYCKNAIATALTATASGTNNLKWYNSASGGTALVTAPTPSTATVGTTTYYVSEISSSGCEGPRAAIDVTINPTVPNATAVATNPTTCSGNDGSILISGLTANTTFTLSYQKGSTTISGSRASDATGNILIFGLTAGSYSNISLSLSTCSSNVLGPFTLTDPAGPAIPTVSNNGPLCTGNNLNLTATSSTVGVSFTWVGPKSFNSTLQNPSLANVSLGSAGTYYVTATLNNCSATGSTTVVVRATPAAPAVNNIAYCQFATAAPLTATASAGNTLNWYTVATGGAPLGAAPTPSTATTGTTVYYVSQSSATGCESVRAAINVTVTITPVITATIINPISCYGTDGSIILKGLSSGTSYAVHYNNGFVNITKSIIADTAGFVVIPNLPASTYSNIYVSLGTCNSNVVGPYTMVDPAATAIPTLSYNGPVCAGNNISLTAITKGNNLTYVWTGPNSFNSTQQNPNINNASQLSAGTYTLTVSSNNCSATKSIVVALKPQLFLTSPVVVGAVCTNTVFNYTATSNNANTSFSWTRNSIPNIQNPLAQSTDTTGTISETLINTSANPVHVLYNFYLTADGCTSAQLLDLIVNPDTKASYTYANLGFCPPVTIDSSNIKVTASAYSSVSWWVNNTLVGNNLGFPGYTITNASDTAIIKLVATNAYGCKSDSMSHSFFIFTKINPDLNMTAGTQACAPDSILFTNNSTGANLFKINFGDGSIDSVYTSINGLEQIKHFYKNAGTYTVTMKASNTCNNTDTTISFLITLNQKPTGDFTTAKSSYCKSETVVFQNNSAAGYSYEWNFGDGSVSTNTNPTHNYTLAGAYTVSLVIKSLNTNASFCTDTIRHIITVNNLAPTAFVSNAVTNNCAPFVFTGTTNQPAGNTVKWIFTDANSIDTLVQGNTATHTFAQAGNYSVTLISFNAAGCSDTGKTLINIFPKPIAAFFASDTIKCLNADTIRFTNKSTYAALGSVTYNWYIDGVLMSSSKDFKYNFANNASTKAATNFNVLLVATNSNGCADSASQKITIVPRSIPSFNILPSQGCAQISVSFTNTSQFSNIYKWYINDSLFSTMNTPYPIVLSKPKTNYFIKLVADQSLGCGADSVFNTVTTYDKPTSGFSDFNMALACTGNLTVQFTDISKATPGSIKQWFWDFGDGQTSNLANPIHAYTQPGNFQITHYVTDDKGCVSDTNYKAVKNFGKPTVKFKMNDLCLQTPSIPVYTTYDFGFGNTAIKTYLWDFGDGTVDTSAHPIHTYKKEGKYTVILTTVADSSCVSDTAMQTIQVLGGPTADFKFINNCVNNQVKFIDASSPGFGQTSINTYKWDFGDGTPASFISNPLHVYRIVSPFYVSLSVSSSLCPTLTDIKTRILNVVEPRAGRAYPPKVTSYGVPTQLVLTEKEAASVQQGGSAASYLWMPSTALSSARVQNPVALYNRSDGSKINYTIAITDTSGCVINDTQEVWIFAEPNILAPTAFTPNHDGVNDIFIPVYVEIMRIQYLRIFDRWGNLIWETADMGKGWDGTINGKQMPMDTYVYMVVGIDVNGKTVSRKGDLTLIRD